MTPLKRLEGANAFLAHAYNPTHKKIGQGDTDSWSRRWNPAQVRAIQRADEKLAREQGPRKTERRGWAPGGIQEFAPIYTKSGGKRPEEPKPDMADFGSATDRQERNLQSYRAMSMEERAEWVRLKTEAPYEPPFVKVEPRRGVGL